MGTPGADWPRLRPASFVSTLRPAPHQRKVAEYAAAASTLAFVLLAPFAKFPLPGVTAFLPAYQSALVVFDLITSVLLLGQYRLLHRAGLVYLAAAYLFSAFMAVSHALSFPGLFAPSGLIGGGPQTTAWIYFLWNGGFSMFIIAYVISESETKLRAFLPIEVGPLHALLLSTVGAVIVVAVTTALHDQLPVIMLGNADTPGKLIAAIATWSIEIVALILLRKKHRKTVLDLWLMVVLVVLISGTAMAAVLNQGRFDLGWYAGRLYGLLANGFVLGILLLENGSMQQRLSTSNQLLGNALAEMRRLNGDLQSFAASLAHDLQQPLVTIRAFSQAMDKCNLTATDSAHLRRIESAAQQANDMVRSLLEFARLGTSKLETEAVELDALVAQARSAVTAAERNRRIEWRIRPLPVVNGDFALLLLVFTNLLSNALKYTRNRADPVIEVAASTSASGRTTVFVRDNGVGFDMSHADRLFKPFERLHTQTEFEGTGMGLANVKRIVERHGGSITAHSQPGEGALFTVEFGTTVGMYSKHSLASIAK